MALLKGNRRLVGGSETHEFMRLIASIVGNTVLFVAMSLNCEILFEIKVGKFYDL